jgi:hypothetical protein
VHLPAPLITPIFTPPEEEEEEQQELNRENGFSPMGGK